jgi:hypothetical protein
VSLVQQHSSSRLPLVDIPARGVPPTTSSNPRALSPLARTPFAASYRANTTPLARAIDPPSSTSSPSASRCRSAAVGASDKIAANARALARTATAVAATAAAVFITVIAAVATRDRGRDVDGVIVARRRMPLRALKKCRVSTRMRGIHRRPTAIAATHGTWRSANS